MTLQMPDYAAVTAADVERACRTAIQGCDAWTTAAFDVPDGERTFANTVVALEEARLALEEARNAWGILGQVAPDGAVLRAARELRDRLRKRLNELDLDERAQAAVRAYAKTAEAAALTGEDARLLRHLLDQQRRQGAQLSPEQRAHMRELLDELSELGTAFQGTLAEWSDGIVVTGSELDGLPEAFVSSLERVGDGYRVSLDYPELRPFLAHARSRERRRELLEKDQRKGGRENLARLERGIAIRAEIAALLGYPSWAAYRTEDRMAGSPETVAAFLEDLRERVAVKMAADQAELAEAWATSGGTGEVRAWDEAFATARLKETRYAVDELALAEYFPLDACLEGLFAVMGDIVGVRFAAVADAPMWHPDMLVFDVFDVFDAAGGNGGDGEDGGAACARIAMDLFPRPGKYKHAMAHPLRQGRRLPDGSWQQPVAVLVTNLTKPSGDRPSLLRHRELITLFHEFGHALHSALSRARHGRYSAETEMDFLEAPSQMLEHWAWDPDVLRRMSRHHLTGEPLPKELLSALLATRTAASGVQTMRLIAYAALDLAFHTPGFDGDVPAAVREVFAKHGMDYVEGTHFPSGWGHQFADYDAGYYVYPWARVLADDLFTRFERSGAMDAPTGAAYRRTILEPGGGMPAAEMVRAFLGRDPDNAAFLRRIGVLSR
ncbi:thimet oligopeptidase [Streptacidiphilus sp. MAP12-33]|uniref:M3 family metallopeptidase n=1 Tax=Streptacidiphilus sp. MAP12-33 TaxID=3156266 RepID=UPI00351362A7